MKYAHEQILRETKDDSGRDASIRLRKIVREIILQCQIVDDRLRGTEMFAIPVQKAQRFHGAVTRNPRVHHARARQPLFAQHALHHIGIVALRRAAAAFRVGIAEKENARPIVGRIGVDETGERRAVLSEILLEDHGRISRMRDFVVLAQPAVGITRHQQLIGEEEQYFEYRQRNVHAAHEAADPREPSAEQFHQLDQKRDARRGQTTLGDLVQRAGAGVEYPQRQKIRVVLDDDGGHDARRHQREEQPFGKPAVTLERPAHDCARIALFAIVRALC
jgi:hypothetical protein